LTQNKADENGDFERGEERKEIVLSKSTLRFGEKLCAATLGIDLLYRKEISALKRSDGLVVLNMGSVLAEAFSNYEEARGFLASLAREALCLPEEDRRLYYTQACLSLDSFCAVRLGFLPRLFSQIGLFLPVDPASPDDTQLECCKRKIRELLTEMNYTGDLKEQSRQWEVKNTVPADEIQQVMEELMTLAREKTGEILELPEGDYYHCVTERNCVFNAKSDYKNRSVVVNIDPVLTRPALKHLVCHECYPGHFMQFSLRQRLYEKGVAAADGLLSVVNHSSSAVFEAIGDAGIEFIDWVENDDDRVNALFTELKAMLSAAASYRLHGLGWPEAKVMDWLRSQALVGGEGWIAGRMKFIQEPARSALIWSYWRGGLGMFGVWKRIPSGKRAEFFDYLYGRLHTVQSLQLFG